VSRGIQLLCVVALCACARARPTKTIELPLPTVTVNVLDPGGEPRVILFRAPALWSHATIETTTSMTVLEPFHRRAPITDTMADTTIVEVGMEGTSHEVETIVIDGRAGRRVGTIETNTAVRP
jgi:hypothetical protein